MATTTMASSMSILNPKHSSTPHKPSSPSPKPITTPSKLNTITTITKPQKALTLSSSKTTTAIASAIFTTLTTSNTAFAVQQVTDLAEGTGTSDNRGTLLLLVIAPAIGWVLFNILQPALNQINKMRSDKSVIIGLGLGGGLMALAESGNEALAAAAGGEAGSDNRGTLLLLVVAPAIGWVLFNILQPALNQINRMRSD